MFVRVEKRLVRLRGPTTSVGGRFRAYLGSCRKPRPRGWLYDASRSPYKVFPHMLHLGNTFAELTVIHDTAGRAVDHLIAIGGRRSDGQAAAGLLAAQFGAVPLDRQKRLSQLCDYALREGGSSL